MTALTLPGSLPGPGQERINTVQLMSQNTVLAWMMFEQPVCGFKCPSQWPYNKCQWEPVFVDRYDWKGWKPGKRDPFSCGYVDKVTYEIDCKDLCLAHDNCNSCQVYTLEEAAEQFICALFEEIVDITTWEDDCEDDWVDDWVYYSTSYWNVYY
ncbi:hypothetical protein EV421DRAFT_1908625 [Armillaria borealis]|uniref:Uncharacterized protein n=1 Tax=Armillaria borealis TaxID=47425 RepID=A0AA39J793_9AGAR|nr:hypothetical protein EV421DRAFT_1908625 [Armillaria borealis]